jgi:hypothetical protein
MFVRCLTPKSRRYKILGTFAQTVRHAWPGVPHLGPEDVGDQNPDSARLAAPNGTAVPLGVPRGPERIPQFAEPHDFLKSPKTLASI